VLRPIKRLLVAVLLIALTLAAAGYFVLLGSLPELDGTLTTDGLNAPVDLHRDAYGVPTISGSSREDVAYGTGFAHAQERFFQMDLLRRQAAGELAALVGVAALPLDRRHRWHRFRQRASEWLGALPEPQRRIIEAYAAGVNAGLVGLGARPFEYLILGAAPEAWRAEDSMLVGLTMFLELNDARAMADISRGYAKAALPAAVFDWLYPPGTRWDAPLAGAPRAPLPLPGADLLNLRDATAGAVPVAARRLVEQPLVGSNSWAVSGALTADGRALVANDMHLGLRVPNIWYRARLVGSGEQSFDVSGVTLPGTPVVITGSNGHVAWAFTNSYGDWSDAVVLATGTRPDTYITADGKERRFDVFEEVIAVKGGNDERLIVRETLWGPVLDNVAYPQGELAVSWIAHHPEAVNFAHLDLETAASATAAMDVANRIGIPPQNFLVGDREGNIGWTIAGRIPERGSAKGQTPALWRGQGGWDGWLSPADYPRILNPANGRLWTANARVVDGEGLRKIGDGGYALGARAAQIRDGLTARRSFTAADMLAIQLDDRARFLERWRGLLLELLDEDSVRNNAERAEFRRLVEVWTPNAAVDSVGYRLVREFRDATRELVFNILATPIVQRFGADVPLTVSNQFEQPLWQVVTQRPQHLLPARYASWRELLLGVLDERLRDYSTRYAGPLARRIWGERNQSAMRHPLSAAVPVLPRWLDMPSKPLPGDSFMPRVQGPAFGSSERFAVAPGDEAAGYLHMPGGQSGHPLSDYYRRGHDDWVRGRPSEFLPGEPVHHLRLQPR